MIVNATVFWTIISLLGMAGDIPEGVEARVNYVLFGTIKFTP